LLGVTNNLAGQLVALFAGNVAGDSEGEGGESILTSMFRPLALPEELPAPLSTLTPTPGPSPTPEPTTTPVPTPTLVFSSEQEQGLVAGVPGLPAGLDVTASQVLLGIVPAGLIVLLTLIVGMRIARRR
jgi:hypothetical protein